MRLSPEEWKRAQTFHLFLKKQNDAYFIETKIFKCESCHGTGLGGIKKEEGFNSYSWDNYSYCDECHGIGYLGIAGGIQIDDTHYFCSKCNGVGCSQCNHGITDWVSHAMG